MRVQLKCEDESLTHQSFKAECDIRNIMKKYKRTGLFTHITSSMPQYGDFTQVQDYQEAMNVVIAAQNAFEQLPAEVRKRFMNDPGELIDFCQNQENRDEMIKLGLIDAISEPVSNVQESVIES